MALRRSAPLALLIGGATLFLAACNQVGTNNITFWDIIWSMVALFFWIMLIWIFIAIFADIFRRNDLSGGWKAIWILVIFIIPLFGCLIYIVSRPKATAQDVAMITQSKAAAQAAAGVSKTDQLATLQAMHDSGVSSTTPSTEAQGRDRRLRPTGLDQAKSPGRRPGLFHVRGAVVRDPRAGRHGSGAAGGRRDQQIRGSCSPTSMSTIRSRADDGAHGDHPRVLGDDRRRSDAAPRRPRAAARIAARTASARRRRARSPRSLPSLATWSGSRPSISQAARTGPGIGIAGSSSDDADARRRGDLVERRRRARRGSGRAARGRPARPPAIAATSAASGWVSDAISTSNSRPSRTLMIATPWSPIGPDRMTASPGAARSAPSATPSRHEADAGGVDEQPVRGPAPDDLGVAGDDLRAACARPRRGRPTR